MNLQQYQELSKRTMPFNGAPANHIEFENMLGNYAMGLVGEIIELQTQILFSKGIEKTMLEIGDVAHYAIGLMTLAKLEVPEHIEAQKFSFGGKDFFIPLLTNAGEIVEHSKKVIYHRHDFMESVLLGASRILSMLKALSKHYGYKFSNILEMNIDKLKTRYPDKFTTQDSIDRIDVK